MKYAVKLSSEIVDEARVVSRAIKRSTAGQIEYWARIGKNAEENPDLPVETIIDLLIAKEQIKSRHVKPFDFD